MLSVVETSPEYFCYLGGILHCVQHDSGNEIRTGAKRILKHGKANTNYVICLVGKPKKMDREISREKEIHGLYRMPAACAVGGLDCRGCL